MTKGQEMGIRQVKGAHKVEQSVHTTQKEGPKAARLERKKVALVDGCFGLRGCFSCCAVVAQLLVGILVRYDT